MSEDAIMMLVIVVMILMAFFVGTVAGHSWTLDAMACDVAWESVHTEADSLRVRYEAGCRP